MDSASTLVVAFGDRSCADSPTALRDLRRQFPSSRVIGCSTSGQIVGDTIQDGGLNALIMKLQTGRVGVAKVTIGQCSDSHRAGEELGRALAAPDLRGVFVLSDGTSVNGTLLSEGLAQQVPAGVPITGGLAGDGDRFERTWVCCDSDPQPGLVAAVGLYGGSVRLWHGCQGGWDPFGPERVVTRSRGNVLYELDGRPALEIYEQYLGDKASALPASALLFPLSLRRPGETRTVVRTVLGVSRADRSMTFAGDLPEGSSVQLMKANFERLIDGAAQAASMIPLREIGGTDAACIPISCVGRRLILKHRAEEELEGVVATLPAGTVHVGFYSYGELSPLLGAGCELHNQTMTITVITEDRSDRDAPHSRAAAA